MADHPIKHDPIEFLWCEHGEHWWCRLYPGWKEKARSVHRHAPKHCPEHRQPGRSAGVSAAMRRRPHLEELVDPIPADKICPSCTRREGRPVIKPASEFSVRKGKPRKDGTRMKSLYTYCKECQKAKSQANRDNMSPEEKLKRSRARVKSHIERYGEEHWLETRRFYNEARRRRDGATMRVSNREVEGTDLVLDLTDEFCSWLAEQSPGLLGIQTGYPEWQIRRWRDRAKYQSKGHTYETKTIKLSQADALLVHSPRRPQDFWGDLTRYDEDEAA